MLCPSLLETPSSLSALQRNALHGACGPVKVGKEDAMQSVEGGLVNRLMAATSFIIPSSPPPPHLSRPIRNPLDHVPDWYQAPASSCSYTRRLEGSHPGWCQVQGLEACFEYHQGNQIVSSVEQEPRKAVLEASGTQVEHALYPGAALNSPLHNGLTECSLVPCVVVTVIHIY